MNGGFTSHPARAARQLHDAPADVPETGVAQRRLSQAEATSQFPRQGSLTPGS